MIQRLTPGASIGKAQSAAVLEHEIEVPDGLKWKLRGMQ